MIIGNLTEEVTDDAQCRAHCPWHVKDLNCFKVFRNIVLTIPGGLLITVIDTHYAVASILACYRKTSQCPQSATAVC